MPTPTKTDYVQLTPNAARLAGRSGAEFERLARTRKPSGNEATFNVSIEVAGGERAALTLPEETLSLIASVLREASHGRRVRVVSADAEITTQDAAEILNVSRPYFVKLLEAGKIPFRSVGSRRRILLSDVIEYKEREASRRLAALDEIVAENQRLGLY